MKVCLLAIAKNEDHYIQEWVDYYLRWNFDDIFIIQDNWKAQLKHHSKIHLIDGYLPESESLDGCKQNKYYSEFIRKYNSIYDWIAIFDIDEFFFSKHHNDIHDFLKNKDDLPSIGIHWRMFGGQNILFNDNYNVINRFNKSCKNCDFVFKSIYNMPKLKRIFGNDTINNVDLISVHTFKDICYNNINGENIRLYDTLQYGYDGSKISIELEKVNQQELQSAKDNVYLAHYRKTYHEFKERYKNTNSEWWIQYMKSMNYDFKKIYDNLSPLSFSEIENLDLINFVKSHG